MYSPSIGVMIVLYHSLYCALLMCADLFSLRYKVVISTQQ